MVNKFVVRNKNRPEMPTKKQSHPQKKKNTGRNQPKEVCAATEMHEHFAQTWKVDYVDVFWCLYTSETNLSP